MAAAPAAAPTHSPASSSSSACRAGIFSSGTSFPNFRSVAASAPGWRRREPYPAVSVVVGSAQSAPGAVAVDTEVWSFLSFFSQRNLFLSYYIRTKLVVGLERTVSHWGGNPFVALSALVRVRSSTLTHDGYKPWMRCRARLFLALNGSCNKDISCCLSIWIAHTLLCLC